QVGGVVEGCVDQVRQLAAVFAAHHPRADGRGEDVGDGLGQMGRVGDRAAGAGGHADHGVGSRETPLPGVTPLVRWLTRLISPAITSSLALRRPVISTLPMMLTP